ncbi:MAG: hypothetical protein ACM3O4_02910 [Ignavibacteriales bacterium]
MNDGIVLSASKVKRKKKIIKIIKLVLFVFMLLLLILYVAAGIVYNSGNFSITLDRNLYLEKNIIIYDDPNYKVYRSELFAKTVDSFDNISYKWLPNDLDNYDGSHNGDNYVAYTFYVENLGEETSDYWAELVIEDSINGVDEAVRIKVYRNGIETTYAKMGKDGKPEPRTVAFESDTVVTTDHIENFGPGDKNKYTVVIWLEGNDPECNDNILGGEIKIYMDFKSEFVEK